MQSGCRFNQVWRVLAVAGSLGVASAALASGPVKTTDQKPGVNNPSKVLPAPSAKGPESKLENLKGIILKGPEDNSQPAVLRGPGPANDLCINAEIVSVPGTAFGNTTGGAPDPEATVLCITQGALSAGVWYTFTGNGNSLTVQTCATTVGDTVLRVLTGTCNALTCVAGNDDACGLRSRVTFPSNNGQTYFAYISYFGSTAVGAFQLDVVDNGAPPPPLANDSCVDAVTITCGTVTVADNTGASVGPEDIFSCRVFGGPGFATIWYKFTATETSARIQTCGSLFPADDSILEVFAGGCGGLVSIGCNDDVCGLLSRVDLQGLTVGQEYHIQLSAWSATDVGPYNLELICPVPQTAPGDVCTTALPFGPIPGTIFGDTTGFEPDSLLCGVGSSSPGVWYSLTGTGGILRATTCNGTFYDSALSVLTGDCASLTCVASNDDACGLQSTVTFLSNVGQTYYIVVRGFGTSSGAFQLEVTDLGPPGPGDNCATAFPLSVPGQAIGNTCAATPESLFCGVGDSSPGLWYAVTGTGNQFIATTCNGSFAYDTALSVLSGNCDFLTCVASNDDACGLQSRVIFPTVLGETYYIVIRGFSTACGDYTLDVAELVPPPNDNCINAIALTCNTSVVADNLGATDNFGEDIYFCRVGGGNGVASIWYTFVATNDSAVIQTCGSLFPATDSYLQIFSSTAGCGTLVPLPDGCNDDGCSGFLSRAIVRNLTVGATYYIMMSSWGPGDVGAYNLELICPAPPPAPGDDCADALPFGPVPGAISGDTSTANPDSVDTCGGPGAAAPGVWYSVVAPAGADRLRASTCGNAVYDTVIRVYNGPCDFLSCVGFNDDACASLQSEFSWDVTPGTEYLVYVGGFGSSSGTFTLTIDIPPPPCEIVPPGGSVDENEPDCASLNGGCNSVPNVFSTISCNVPVFGSSFYDGFTRDTDWYELTLTEPANVTLSMSSEFLGVFGFVGTAAGPIPQSPTFCSQITQISVFATTSNDCSTTQIAASLGAGTWVIFAGPVFTSPAFTCGGSGSNYLLTVTADAGCGGEDDCNGNGIPDAVEIAGGARDCFNPLVITVPGTAGGSDGFLDECQCVANWNRDAAVNSNDISAFISSWLNAVGGGTAVADINCDGLTNSNDISAFISVWLTAVQNTIPFDGCP